MAHKKYKRYRLPDYDYSSAGSYFITVCTKNRVSYFGSILLVNNQSVIELTPIGAFVQECISSISSVYKNVVLGETTVMPNNIHLVITIPENVGSRLGVFLQQPQQSALQKLMSPNHGLHSLVPQSVSSIINHLKGKVKKWCNDNGYADFAWQARFHDHVIRNAEEYNAINHYILNNVENWANDADNVMIQSKENSDKNTV